MAMMEEQTQDWHAWRRTGIGGSDAPIIMGVSKYKTPRQLWLEWTGRVEKEATTFVQAMGHKNEPKARATIEEYMGTTFEKQLVTHPDHPWMRASLDGAELGFGRILEIKYNDDEKHEQALTGQIPEEHYPQCQHNLACCPGAVLLYVSWPHEDPESNWTYIPVHPDEEYLDLLLRKEAEFIEFLATDTAPPKTDRDGEYRNDKKWISLERKYAKALERYRKARDELSSIKNEMVEVAQERATEGDQFRLVPQPTKGQVQYHKIPQLQGINLDHFRKEGRVDWKIQEKPTKESKDPPDLKGRK